MSHVLFHAATAVPFLLAGEWQAALFCVAPDITWVPHEIRYWRSDLRPWIVWAESDDAMLKPVLIAYRLAHSWVLAIAVGGAAIACDVEHAGICLLAYLVHLTLDLPTHYGELAQRPLYPFSNWKWRWTI